MKHRNYLPFLITLLMAAAAFGGSTTILKGDRLQGKPSIDIVNGSATLTLPSSTDTIVGRATTDTLTNKTISSGTFSGTSTFPGSTAVSSTGNVGIGVSPSGTTGLGLYIGGSSGRAGQIISSSSDPSGYASMYFGTASGGGAWGYYNGKQVYSSANSTDLTLGVRYHALTIDAGYDGGASASVGGLNIDSTGKVGIGASPSYKLHVSTPLTGTTYASNRAAHFTAEASGREVHIGFGDGTNASTQIGYINSGDMYFGANGSERMRLTTAGKIGIGYSNPTNYLEVSSPGTQFGIYNSAGLAERLLISADSSGVIYNSYDTNGTAVGSTWKTNSTTRMTLSTGGVLSLTNTSESSSKDTGTIVVEGGIGVEKSLFTGAQVNVGTNLTVGGTTTLSNLTARHALVLDASKNVAGVAPGAAGNVLKSDGTSWTSAANSPSLVHGALTLTGATNCSWSITQTAYTSDFSADSDCNTWTATGGISAPATKIPAFNATLATGVYVVYFNGLISAGEQLAMCRLTNGTINSTNDEGVFSGASGGNIDHLNQHFTFYLNVTSDQAASDYKIQCQSASGAVTIAPSDARRPASFIVHQI